MKRQILRMASLAMTMGLLCSCLEERYVETGALTPGTVALVLDGNATRSNVGSAIRVNTYNAGKDNQGNALSLEEVVSEMDALGVDVPATRGTPAYTSNVTSVHGTTFNGVAYGSSGQIVIDDGEFSIISEITDKSVWRRVIGFDPWAVSDPLYFFMRMPANPEGVTNLAYNYSAGSIAFDYETPSTASAQKDILFAARRLSESTYTSESKSKGGAAILFRHALTGVKFAVGNNETTADDARYPAGKVETFIREVSITGLKDKGHAVFVPTGTENATQEDDIHEYSSAGSFKWTDVSGTSNTVVYKQAYGENDIQDFTKDDQVGAPDSFYSSGQNRNLNKADASLTFWFIPQEITSALKITVKFQIWDGQNLKDEETLVLKLGELILAQSEKDSYTNKEWKAGQLRTFMLKPNVVDVDIKDDVEGFTKSNVEIRNTGNVKAFLRAHIVANWFGETADGIDGIALGFKAEDSEEYIDGWEMISATTDNYGGEFTGLPGDGWVKGSDGFYYFTSAVDPGALTDTPLFTSYHLDTSIHPVPEIWYLDSSRKQFSNVRLVMEIPVQAIEAKGTATYTQAWAETVTP